MENKPKTKEVVRTVKEHGASPVKDKMTAAGVKAKDRVLAATKEKVDEQIRPEKKKRDNGQSPESYATDQVEEKAEQTAEGAAAVTTTAVKTGVKAVKKRVRQKKADAIEETEAEKNTETNNPEAASTDDPNKTESSTASDRAPETEGSDKKPTDGKTERPGTQKDDSPVSENKSKDEQRDRISKKKSDKETKSKRQAGDKRIDKSGDEPQTTGKSSQAPSESNKPKQTDTRKIRQKSPEKASVKSHSRFAPKQPNAGIVPDAPEREIQPKARRKAPPETRGQQTIKSIGNNARQIRKAETEMRAVHRIDRDAKKTIKTADKAYKAAEKSAKAAKKTTEATAKAAKRAEEAARVTAKAAAKAAVTTAKAVIEAIKASVAVIKELIAAIASGGTTALVIIIVICLIAAIGGTCFGIFLSNDKTTGTQMTMTEAISKLMTEHYTDLTQAKAKFDYDTMEITGGSISIDWKSTLAVYAVKTTTSTGNAYEVVTLDDNKLDLLRTVVGDMNQVTYTVTPKTEAQTETTTDENGNTVTTTKYVTKNILTVTVKQMTVDEIIEKYNFNEEQKKQLEELLSDDYDDLWKELIGNAGATGDVLITNATYVPTDIFAWPLQSNGNITSGYGYRHDPKTGEWKLHGGTDIAAPTGTPILASADGVVVATTWHNSYGYYVKIQHNATFSTLYGHCSALHVTAGQQVKQGQIIADVGQTGYATGPHVHFEVYVYGVRVNAMNYFQ